MNKIVFSTDSVAIEAELNGGRTATAILDALPVSAPANTWGEEIYFDIPPVEVAEEKGTLEVKSGDVAFWPEGNCLCVFFGRTPASVSEDPVPASPVIWIGKVTDGVDRLHIIKAGERISVNREQ